MRQHHLLVRSRNARSGHSLLPLVAAAGLFALVLGFLFFQRGLPQQDAPSAVLAVPARPSLDASETAAHKAAPAARQLAANPAVERFDDDNSPAPVPVAAVVPDPITAAPNVVSSDPQDDGAQRDPAQLVAAQLAAGEFGPALETARGVADVGRRSALLQQIVDAQLAEGEFASALMSVRQIPDQEQQIQASTRRATQLSLTGGMGGADFGPLMDLIQNQTDGPWQDVDGDGGTMSSFGEATGGISVDPRGLMRHVSRAERGNRLALLGLTARRADLNDDLSRGSELRWVSLTRLERAVAQRTADGQPVVETMKLLAGLSRVRYVVCLPEDGQVLVGGPAEPWSYNADGLPVGQNSGRPILQLDDLVTVLRTFSRDGEGIFTCSIDPRPAGLKQVREFMERSGDRALTPAMVRNRVRRFRELLGLQDVTIRGIPNVSRVARVIAEADYRMKLIGIDKLDAGPEIPSFFDLLEQAGEQNPPAMDALRWWLTMKYDAVLHSESRDVFEIQGASVLCLSENEFINAQGQRVQSGKSEPVNRLFAQNFTKHYLALARRDPVFADLQNVFDLSLVAALIQQERLDRRADWDRGAFAIGKRYAPATYDAPQTVMSVANHRLYNGKDIVIQVAGGVRGDLLAVVRDRAVLRPGIRLGAAAPQPVAEGRWWWDAK